MEYDKVKELKEQLKIITKKIEEINNYLQEYFMEAGFIEQEIKENKIEGSEELGFLIKDLNDINDIIDSLIEQRDNLEGQYYYLRGQLNAWKSDNDTEIEKLNKAITKLQENIFLILMSRPDREFKDKYSECFDSWEITMYEPLKKLQLRLKYLQGLNNEVKNIKTTTNEGEYR